MSGLLLHRKAVYCNVHLEINMTPYNQNPKDPLHGITLENLLTRLVQRHGWREMGQRIPVRCFTYNPSIKSSLTFLRKTPWARKRVEDWFIRELTAKPIQ